MLILEDGVSSSRILNALIYVVICWLRAEARAGAAVAGEQAAAVAQAQVTASARAHSGRQPSGPREQPLRINVASPGGDAQVNIRVRGSWSLHG